MKIALQVAKPVPSVKEVSMQRVVTKFGIGWLVIAFWAGSAFSQKTLTWQEVRDRFEAANPIRRAGQIGIDESRAQEITANLRPNPNLTMLTDQIDPFNGGPPHGPFAYFLASGTISQLWERQHKRGLRLESAQKATAI